MSDEEAGRARDFTFSFKKLSFTGEPCDPATLEFIADTFRVPACSMYGTTDPTSTAELTPRPSWRLM